VAGNLIPRVREAVESPLVGGLENLAFWIAVVVMMFSFARLFRENDGATKDLFWWLSRLAIVFTLFGTARASSITNQQAAANKAAARVNRDHCWRRRKPLPQAGSGRCAGVSTQSRRKSDQSQRRIEGGGDYADFGDESCEA